MEGQEVVVGIGSCHWTHHQFSGKGNTNEYETKRHSLHNSWDSSIHILQVQIGMHGGYR